MGIFFLYKLSNSLYRWRVPFLPLFISRLIRLIYSAWVPYSAMIGNGTVLGYGGLGIVIHSRAVIGEFCHIDQHVTIGGTSKKKEVPVLGHHVYVGAGAKILGPIKIGDNVVIGANAVVLTDIPSNSLVVGVPGRVIKSNVYMIDYV